MFFHDRFKFIREWFGNTRTTIRTSNFLIDFSRIKNSTENANLNVPSFFPFLPEHFQTMVIAQQREG